LWMSRSPGIWWICRQARWGQGHSPL